MDTIKQMTFRLPVELYGRLRQEAERLGICGIVIVRCCGFTTKHWRHCQKMSQDVIECHIQPVI